MSPGPDLADDVWSRVQSLAEAYDLDRSTLAAHVRAVADDTPPSHVEDLVLALACARGHAAAIRDFETRLLPQTRPPVARIDATRAFVDEVQQRVRTHLLVAEPPAQPRIATYAGRGPLAGWITVTAVRTAMTVLRENARASRFSEARWAAAIALPTTADEDLEHLKRRYRPKFELALVEAAKALPDRERSVLKLSFAEGLGIDRIAAIYGVHRATVARWVVKAKEALLAGTHEVLQRDEGITRLEIASLQRLVRSQLETSLGGLFS